MLWSQVSLGTTVVVGGVTGEKRSVRELNGAVRLVIDGGFQEREGLTGTVLDSERKRYCVLVPDDREVEVLGVSATLPWP